MDKAELFIPVLEGTTRQDRRSIHVSKLITSIGSAIDGVKTILVDPQDYHFPYDGKAEENKDPRYTKITEDADAFFIVAPEYNHSFPGSLKRMLDSELKNYIHKPVAFAGVTSGQWGGVRAIEALVTAVREMGMVATFTDVQFPRVQDLFDDAGKLLDEAYIARIERSFTELVWMTRALKWGRENLPSSYHV